MIREMTIDGVKAPAQGSVQLIQQVHHIQIPTTKPVTPASGATVRLMPGGGLANMANAGQTTTSTAMATGRPPITPKSIHKYKGPGTSITVTPTTTPLATGSPMSTISRQTLSAQKKKEVAAKSKSPAASKERKDTKKKEEKDTYSNSLRDDDDINDVAAMGGVNLMEEHQRILATNAEFVGAQIRSCKDEPFLSANPLQSRINKIGLFTIFSSSCY